MYSPKCEQYALLDVSLDQIRCAAKAIGEARDAETLYNN